MKKVLLIGPSYSGKSSVLKLIARNPSFETYDLDDLIAEQFGSVSASKVLNQLGFAHFSIFSIGLIESIYPLKPTIISVGAGSIHHPDYNGYFLRKESILMIGDPEVLHSRRNPSDARNLEEYKKWEFSQDRMKLYYNFKNRVDTTSMGIQDTRDSILRIIKDIQNPKD